MAKISILGSGGWGTAIAVMLAKENNDVTLWSYKEEEKNELVKNRENIPYLPGIKIPDSVRFTSDMADCAGADVTVIATPSHGVRNVARSFSSFSRLTVATAMGFTSSVVVRTA